MRYGTHCENRIDANPAFFHPCRPRSSPTKHRTTTGSAETFYGTNNLGMERDSLPVAGENFFIIEADVRCERFADRPAESGGFRRDGDNPNSKQKVSRLEVTEDVRGTNRRTVWGCSICCSSSQTPSQCANPKGS